MTAFFPVKTLQSITVVSTPAAPTCLLGKTAEIALVVTASYINPTTTEVVTTYTTGTNYVPATKVFTPATTVAGTENIVVSYTFDGTTKTFDVPVTVTAEAPKPTTVTVTAIALTENASKTAEVVVKDQFGATMTDCTLTYVSSNEGVATVATTGVVTALPYNSTSKTATLTVTATATSGTATGTATITVSADTVKPTLVSAQALNSTTLLVTYDKKMATNALTVASYSLLVSGGTLNALQANAGAGKINATAVFYDTTQKVVRLTINADSAVSGYAAGGFTNGTKYFLYITSTINDLATTPNAVQLNSNVEFTGTSTPDASKPALISAKYNKGTGNLELTFSKIIGSSSIDYTKVKFNGTALTAAVTGFAGADSSKISFDVAAADKVTIAALTGDITVTLLASAVVDKSSPAIGNDEISMVATVTVPPALVAATYTEATDTLTLGFDQIIDLANSTINGSSKFQLKLNDTTSFYLTSTDIVQTTANNKTIEVKLASANISTIESGTFTTPKVLVAADAVKNGAGTYNVKQNDDTGYPAIALTIVKDTTKPVVQSISFDETTKKLTIAFNTPVQPTMANQTSFLVKTTKDDSQIAAFTTNINSITTSGNNLVIDMGTSSHADNKDVAYKLKLNQQGSNDLATFTPYQAYVVFAAGTFTKAGSILTNDAVTTKATATTVTYTDNFAPFIGSWTGNNSLEQTAGTITEVDASTISFTFNEKLDKTTVEAKDANGNYTNFSITNTTTNSSLPIYSVLMTDAPVAPANTVYTVKNVTIVTGVQTSGNSYKLTINGVKDASGNAMANVEKTFSGSATPSPNPYPVSATIKDNGNNALDTDDYIAVTFDRPIKISTTSSQYVDVNFSFDNSVSGAAAFTVNYDKSNLTVDATNDKVALIKVDSKLATGANKVVVGATKINAVATKELVMDKFSNVVAKANAGGAVTITSPGGTPAVSKVEYKDTNANNKIDKGDEIFVTFGKEVKAGALDKLKAAGDYAMKYDDATPTTGVPVATGSVTTPFGTSPTFSTSITQTTAGTTVTITLGENPGITPLQLGRGLYVGLTGAGDVVDSWAVGNVAFNVATVASYVKVTPKVIAASAPKITDVSYVTLTGASNDYLIVTFDNPVWFVNADPTVNAGTALVTKDNWKNLANNFASVAYYDDSNLAKLKLVFGTDQPTLVGQLFDVLVAGVAHTNFQLTNLNGDKTIVNGTGVQVKYPVDVTAPVVTSAAFISNNEIKLVFDKTVDVSGFAGANVNVKTAFSATNNPSAATPDAADTTGKTVILTFSASAFNGYVTDGITTAPDFGLEFSAGSKVLGKVNGLEVAAFNTSLTPKTAKNIDKDSTAPTAYLNKVDKNSLYTGDQNNNGKIDHIVFRASEVLDSAFTPAVADVTVSGYTVSSVVINADGAYATASGDGAYMVIKINEGSLDTGATPNVAIAASKAKDKAGNYFAGLSTTAAFDKALPVMSAVATATNRMTITFSENVYSTANASGALIAGSISFSTGGDATVEDLSAITHTAGTSTAVATTTSVVNAPTGKFGAKTATSVYDAAGNAVPAYDNATATTKFATAHQSSHLDITATTGKVVRLVKIGTGTVQYVKADGSGVQNTPAELTVANPFVPGLTAADKYTVQVLTPVAATGGALTLGAGDRTGAVVRVTKLTDGVVTYAGATTGIAMAANATVITDNTSPFVVGTGLTATDKYIVEIIAATDVKTANGAGLITLNAGAQTGNVIRLIKAGTATVEYSAAADAAAIVSNATILTSVANPHTMTGTAAGVYATEAIAAANILTVQ